MKVSLYKKISIILISLFISLIFVEIFGEYVALIPMAALVAIMIMVSVGTFSWSSITNLTEHPKSSSIVMISTVFFVIYTHNLAIGVGIGVLLSGIFFAWKIAQLFSVDTSVSPDGRERTYLVKGQLFFASAEDFVKSFDFYEANEKVVIDLTEAHIWDISSIAALDTVVLWLRREGKSVQVIGLNKASKTIVDDLAAADLVEASNTLKIK